MTNISKLLMISALSLGLTYCGSASEEGTNGGQFTVIGEEGEQVEIATPEISTSKSGNDITLTISEDNHEYFAYYEIERKVGSDSFAYLTDTDQLTLEQQDLGGGTYTYRVRAIYMIDGNVQFSQYSNESAETILFTQNPNGEVVFNDG